MTVFNVVDGNSYVGALATDGSTNAVQVDGNEYVGMHNSAGAINIVVDLDDSGAFGVNHPSGALRVVSVEDTYSKAYTPSGAVAAKGIPEEE